MWILLAILIVQGAAPAGGPAPIAMESTGRFDARAIPEASGIVQSRRHPGIFWVHNDSGNPPLLFAVRADGAIVRRYRLAIPNLDWEDIAIDDRGHLYIGDTGNNVGFLRVRTIYRLDEPDPSSPEDREAPMAAERVIPYRLPVANRFDAEGLFVDRGTAVVVAKYLDGREAELFAVPVDRVPSETAAAPTPRSIGRLPGFHEPATGADLSADGTLLAVCSYAVTRVYRRNPAGGWDRLAEVRYATAPIEGVAWDGRDLVLAAEEARGLYRLREAAWRAPASARDGSRTKAE